MVPGKFAGTDLAKANLEVTACISWFWADKFGEEAWESAVAGADLIPLGAEPISKLPRPAEAGWKIPALARCWAGTPYSLAPWPVFALQTGPVVILRHISGHDPRKNLFEAGKILRKTITARITERLQG